MIFILFILGAYLLFGINKNRRSHGVFGIIVCRVEIPGFPSSKRLP